MKKLLSLSVILIFACKQSEKTSTEELAFNPNIELISAQAHMQLGQQRTEMFTELINLTGQYCVSGILGAPVVRSM
jgi:hypothetical protein